MKKAITATVDGVELVLCASDPQPGDPELWQSWGAWDGPNDPAPITEWPQRIADWKLAKQAQHGFTIWNLSHDRPKYWEKRTAIFRSGDKDRSYPYGDPIKVLTRNSNFDPDNLYPINYCDCAMDTPEVAKAIETARKLHAEAVDALRRFKDAAKAIPRMTLDDWHSLPDRHEKGQ